MTVYFYLWKNIIVKKFGKLHATQYFSNSIDVHFPYKFVNLLEKEFRCIPFFPDISGD